MNSKDYIQNVLKTEALDYEKIKHRIATRRNVRLLHAMIGIQTESGEFSDSLKKYFIYGKEIDDVNLKEEIGDLLWYVALALDELNFSFEEVMQMNIDKLRARYGEKFSEEKAISRTLAVEREILEGSHQEELKRQKVVDSRRVKSHFCGLGMHKSCNGARDFGKFICECRCHDVTNYSEENVEKAINEMGKEMSDDGE